MAKCSECNQFKNEECSLHVCSSPASALEGCGFFSPITPLRGDSVKNGNPKDSVGVRKVPVSAIPWGPILEAGLAMMEGARKYGRHNYRKAGVRASVYFDAVVGRHLVPWWEGEDIDPDSGLSHVTKAIAGLLVLRDSMLSGNWVDDRPPRNPVGLRGLNEKASEIIERYPDSKPAFTQKG